MDAERHSSLDQVASDMEKARTASAHPSEYFDFRIELARSAAGAYKEAVPLAGERDVPPDSSDRLFAGNAVLKPGALPFDERRLAMRAEEVSGIFERHGMDFGSAARDRVREDRGSALKWVRMALARDRKGLSEEAGAIDVPGQVLSFIAAETARPDMVRTAEALRPLVRDERWKRGHCPICSANPSFSKYEGEGGRRFLLCSVCGTIWVYQRIRCPFCESSEKGSQGFWRSEDDPLHRVDFCETCKRYIKASDRRAAAEGAATALSLEADEAATLYLDLAAEKKGYKGWI